MKIALKIIAALLVIILPFAAVPVLAFSLPEQFSHSFYGALDEKVDRLASIEGEKIVVVGGSSVAFGLDSELIERYTGMPVVNFGLYGALGTKLMLDLSVDHIGDGDVVILAPELDAQTLSMYFNSAATLRATDGNADILLDLPIDHAFSLLASTWGLAGEKIEYIINSTTPNPSGVYNSKSFNEYGDVTYKRTENVMSFYYDPNSMIDLSPEILDSEFAQYLNEYIEKCEKKGASVYFTFCPMNEMALTDSDPNTFAKHLESEIDCTFISSIEDYILPAGYFYDTNLHLNDAGVTRRTVSLLEDLLLELGLPIAVVEKVPEPPELPALDLRYFGDDENARYFEYAKLADGSYMITGVKNEYKSLRSLTVPLGYDTYKVTQIGARAFADTALEALVLTEDTNIRRFMNGCFHGATNLTALYIYYPTESDILPPADFSGVGKGFKVYVPVGTSYSTGYYWSVRGLDFEFIKEEG